VPHARPTQFCRHFCGFGRFQYRSGSRPTEGVGQRRRTPRRFQEGETQPRQPGTAIHMPRPVQPPSTARSASRTSEVSPPSVALPMIRPYGTSGPAARESQKALSRKRYARPPATARLGCRQGRPGQAARIARWPPDHARRERRTRTVCRGNRAREDQDQDGSGAMKQVAAAAAPPGPRRISPM
jgi:hypothetical protein